MTRKQHRLSLVVGGLVVLGAAAALVLNAFSDNIVFFVSPSELSERDMSDGRRFRLGGLVEEGSVVRTPGGIETAFVVTDGAQTVSVQFRGLLPDLFREGQGVITEGALNTEGVFVATEVLAKHDENYMPAEVAESIKKAGHWKDATD